MDCFFWVIMSHQYSLVQFSHSVVSDSLQPHGLQHARLPCPSPTPRTYSNSCPSSWWCHPTNSSSVVPFSSSLQSCPASSSFPMSPFFASGGQSIGSFSFGISPSNEYSRTDFLQDWLVWSPCSPDYVCVCGGGIQTSLFLPYGRMITGMGVSHRGTGRKLKVTPACARPGRALSGLSHSWLVSLAGAPGSRACFGGSALGPQDTWKHLAESFDHGCVLPPYPGPAAQTCRQTVCGVQVEPNTWHLSSQRVPQLIDFSHCSLFLVAPLSMRGFSSPIRDHNYAPAVEAVVVQSLSHVWLFCDPVDCSLPDCCVPGISQQEYWSRLPFPSPGDLPDLGVECSSLASPLAGGFLTGEPPGSHWFHVVYSVNIRMDYRVLTPGAPGESLPHSSLNFCSL